MKLLFRFTCASLLVAGAATAQIRDVVNAGSRLPSGLPSYGIAQGAIFVVTGKDVGPAGDLVQASFPLPTTDGLGGVSIQASVGGTNVDAIMVYVSNTEVGAILPSSTPTGTGTLTLNNNGTQLKAPITVVKSAFGSFTASQNGAGPALAFNVNSDGSTTLNTVTQSAQNGQTVMLNGTGLGGITSDETQSGVTDSPGADIKLWVGGKQATVTSAGRATCCTGVDASFRIPQGVAGWDVIQFVVPDGVSGCGVGVAVQTGNIVSNFATIAVGPGGQGCTDPTGFSTGDLAALSGSLKLGTVTLSRTSTKISMQGISIDSKSDAGSASFLQFDLSQFQSNLTNGFSLSAFGSCLVSVNKVVPGERPVGVPTYTELDAGDAINVTRSGMTKQMKKNGFLGYSADFGTSQTISGLPPGVSLPPGLGGGGTPFLDAGNYTADNGSGGPGVGGFNATLTVPDPLNWTNQDAIQSVVRANGVNVTWNVSGDPDALVNIIGSSSVRLADGTLTGTFICTEKRGAGQFAVPAVVTLSLPPSSAQVPGLLLVQSTVSNRFTASGIDYGLFSSSVGSAKTVSYQ